MAKLACVLLALLGAQVIGLKVATGESSGWNSRTAARYFERKLHRPETECLCKPWSLVYRLVPGACGNGGEFASVMVKHKVNDLAVAKSIWNETLCNNFFRILDTDECVLHRGDDEKGTYSWCYTDASCHAPDMDDKVPTSSVVGKEGEMKFLAKKCTAGVDRLLSDRTPEQLVNLKAQFGDQMKLHVLLSFAYPMTRFSPNHFKLDFFKRIINVRGDKIGGDRVTQKAYSLVEPNMPMLASVSDHEQLIVLGKTLYMVKNADEKLECLTNCPGSGKFVWNPKAAADLRRDDQTRDDNMENYRKGVQARLKHFPVESVEKRFDEAFEEMEKDLAKDEAKFLK